MQESFHHSGVVSRDALRRLGRRDDARATRRLLVQLALLAVAVATVLTLAGGPWWALAPAVVVCGLLFATLFAPLHECSHGTAFRSRRANALVPWLSAGPLFWPPTAYREFHFEHHRHTHCPQRDPEIAAGGERFAMWPVLVHEYLAVGSGVLLLLMRSGTLLFFALGAPDRWWDKVAPFIRQRCRRRVAWESRVMVCGYAAIALAAWYWWPALGWVALSLVATHSALALYLASEHTGCPTTGSIFDRTRSIQSNRLVRYLMWNMPYHAEHHAYPSVPFHALPALRRLVAPELRHTSRGYVALHAGVARGLRWTPSRRRPGEVEP